MKNLESGMPNGRGQELWNNSSSNNGISFKQANQNLNSQHKPSMMKLDLEQPADEYIAESNGADELLDESEIELTLGLGPTNHSRKKKPETPRTTSRDSGPSFSSSSTGSSHINRTNHIRAREVLAGCELGLVEIPGSIKNEEQLRQQERINQQPPWLFQALSLNMT